MYIHDTVLTEELMLQKCVKEQKLEIITKQPFHLNLPDTISLVFQCDEVLEKFTH